MEIEVNINKTYAMIILGVMFLLAGGLVYAYGGSSPSVVGHSAGEINLGSLQTTYVRNSRQKSSVDSCCSTGWARTGCGESGDSDAYSYPWGDKCCRGKFEGDGYAWAICTRIV